MTSRDEAMQTFLHNAGWAEAQRGPLAGDASARRYLRLQSAQGAAVLMDAPPGSGEDIQPFTAMTRWLREHDLSAPEILAEDSTAGFLLLEDLGDDLYARHVLAQPESEITLYKAATELLLRLAEIGPAPHLAAYDHAVLRREADLFSEWWLPAATQDASTWRVEDYAGLLDTALPPVAETREVTVLRDYHAENLLWLPARGGLQAVGLLDYQDALSGHPAYDLMSLLEDARRDTSAELREAMIQHYLAARPKLHAEDFRRDYAILAAQRNLKIIGIFARLALRDGKPRYLDLIPRVWGHLMRDLAHPDLAGVRDWVTMHAPKPSESLLARVAG